MCTLTWAKTEEGYRLLFNRDESLTRPEAELPRVFEEAGGEFVAPIDPLGAGTWIASNGHGVTLCMLNDYRSEPTKSAQETPRSRGLLVKELAPCADVRSVLARVASLDLSVYRPFTLVAFTVGAGPIAFHHGARDRWLTLCPERPVTSAGLFPDRVHDYRRQAFSRLLSQSRGELPLTQMRRYHRGDFTSPGPLSVAMSAEGRATVSVTEVEVDAQRVRMAYYPGHPGQSRLLSPAEEVVLPRSSRRVSAGPRLAVPADALRLRSAIERKSPRLAERMPGWCFPLMERALGLSGLARVLQELGPVSADEFAERALGHLGVQVRVLGTWERQLSADEPHPVYAVNHPLGGIDGLSMLALLQHLHDSVMAPVNDVLIAIPHVARFGIGIDKSKTSKIMLQAIDRLFAARSPILVFPAGATSKKDTGHLQDEPWGKMFVRRAIFHGRPVVPVFISGENSALFYAVSKWRKRLKVRFNFEMFLLLRQLLHHRPSSIVVHLGERVGVEELRSLGSDDAARADALRSRCYALRGQSEVE